LASGASLYWDGDGTAPLGGNGVWNTSSLQWWTGTGYQAWNNAAGDNAIFDTVGGSVAVPSQVNVHNIDFNATGYAFSNGWSVQLVGTAPTISVVKDAVATISSQIIGASGLNKAGAGLLDLNGYNTYTGATTISGGALRLSSYSALPSGFQAGNLNIAGGVVELSQYTTNFTRSLGTGTNQVQFTGSGGFSAYNTSPYVTLGGGTSLTWGSGGFVPDGAEFILGSPWSNATVGFQNSINLGNSVRTIRAEGSSPSAGGYLSGTLTGSGGLNKTGNGTLGLAPANSYTGPTIVTGGILSLATNTALPGGLAATGGKSNLNIAGGVVELVVRNGDPGSSSQPIFSRSIGTNPDQVQFTGSGGFQVAYGSDAYFLNNTSPSYGVNLGGNSAPLTWGSGGFVPDGAALVLGSWVPSVSTAAMLMGSANPTVVLDFQNPIDFGASNRTVQVTQGVARLSGALTGAGGLEKTGIGTLELAAANQNSGPTVVREGALRLSHPQAIPGGIAATGGTSNLVIAGGVVELNDGNFYRALGTGPDQVQFTTTGGFSAFTTSSSSYAPPVQQTRIVNLGGQSAQVHWGSGGFVPDGSALILKTSTTRTVISSTPSLDFQNPIDLGSSLRTVQTDTSSPYPSQWNSVTLSGALSGQGGLVKTGTGALTLAAANTYSGETQVTNGILRLAHAQALPGGIGPTGGTSHLLITGGAKIAMDCGDFQRNLGAGPAEVQFSGSGGFTGGANHAINLGGASAPVLWDNNPYLPNNFTLVLENSGSSGPIDFQNPLILGAGKRTISTSAGSGDTHARLSGGVSGVGGLKKTGGLVLELTAANSYTGQTEVNWGALRLSHAEALPGGIATSGGKSNLTFTGGVVELAAGDFTRGLGTGDSQVQFTGSGGFSAYGADRTVNLGGASATVAWGTSSFVPTGKSLTLSSDYSNATVDFQNPIDFGSAVRTVGVANGTAAVDARLTGRLSGAGGLGKAGDGTLELTAANTYSGQTVVHAGALRLSHWQALPGGTGVTGGTSNLSFSDLGGVVELASGDFFRGLGTAPNQVQFDDFWSGGFSAVGADRIVNLGGASAQVTSGENFFTPSLILGCASADATVDFQNPINFGSSTRTITVDNGSARIDGKISGSLSGTGGLRKDGYGTLQLTASNTYSGTTSVQMGTLLVDGSLNPTSQVTVSASATLGGTGTVGQVLVYSGGHIAPGDSIGTLAITGGLTLRAGAKLDFDLGALTASDEILMENSTLSLNGQQFADFAFHAMDGFGQGTYLLVDAALIQGGLGANCSGMIGGLPAALFISGNDLVLTVVPEPSAISLLGIGVASLFAYTWRRRRQAR
jgi:autotransporter-associated beta strand protein